MNTTIKKLLVLLAGILILSSALFACAEDIPADTSSFTETTEQIITEALETEPPVPEFYDIVTSGICSYKIVYPANLPTDGAVVKAALNIRKSFERFTSSLPEIGDDWIKEGESYNSESLEILVGHTDYPETAEVISELGYGDYIIRAVGNKIVVLSHSDEGYIAAANRFSSLLFGGLTKKEDGTSDVRVSAEHLNSAFTVEKMASAIPVYDGGSDFLALDMSEGAFGIIIEDTTPEEYKKYLEELAESGYKTHAENEISGSLFATVYTEEYTVNAG